MQVNGEFSVSLRQIALRGLRIVLYIYIFEWRFTQNHTIYAKEISIDVTLIIITPTHRRIDTLTAKVANNRKHF